MVYVFLYKIICLFIGLVIIFLGYKLFLKGIFNESGDVEGNWNDFKVVVKKAAPGTYFVLFGSLIIAATIFKGMENEEIGAGSRISKGMNKNRTDSLNISNDSVIIK